MYHRDNLNTFEVNHHDRISLFPAANYCTYKGSHYEENDRWEDGCKVCVCVDGVSSCGLQTCQRVVCEEVRVCASLQTHSITCALPTCVKVDLEYLSLGYSDLVWMGMCHSSLETSTHF